MAVHVGGRGPGHKVRVSSSGSGPAPAAPVNTSAPVVSGTLVVGETLSCTTGAWDAWPPPDFTYEWRAVVSGVIGGATSSTYLLTASEEGDDIICEVTATNASGNASEDSNTVGPIEPAEEPEGIGEPMGLLLLLTKAA